MYPQTVDTKVSMDMDDSLTSCLKLGEGLGLNTVYNTMENVCGTPYNENRQSSVNFKTPSPGLLTASRMNTLTSSTVHDSSMYTSHDHGSRFGVPLALQSALEDSPSRSTVSPVFHRLDMLASLPPWRTSLRNGTSLNVDEEASDMWKDKLPIGDTFDSHGWQCDLLFKSNQTRKQNVKRSVQYTFVFERFILLFYLI
ncbi:hypothetical protein RFI_15635 [Reticulomyxa filosa]|uniref:Uncharacterized protein n=1 Tax=Reticulomyxa filosa TaxID=46433 RepID=X6N6J4_RETFI|nr:hypothetical protein RFI_15635 [Reticulomyxa filosa]|eukprot:ETO21568.1 hypothetical protein RFI_15635 [Reticulomyxa filosa]